MASQLQKEMGMVPQMIEGRRVTDEETLKVVTMVYADTIASSVAVAMANYRYRSPREVCCRCEECTHCSDDGRLSHETELIYCFEKDGVLYDKDDDNSVIPQIDKEGFAKLKADGIVADGMIPKLTNSFKAIDSGVARVVIKHAGNLLGSTGTTLK